ncbi:MAG: hypothetical protein ABIE74_04130 [Pseudomonadota bacterium]
MTIAIHVSHEATNKIGGIGSVLHGLIVAKKYKTIFPRTLLYSPLFNRDTGLSLKLGKDSDVLYSSLDQFDKGMWGETFSNIEKKYGVHIVYGKKRFYKENSKRKYETVDIVAVDIWDMYPDVVNRFKYQLWEHFKIESNLYQNDNDYEQYLRIGVVLRDIYEALYGKNEKAALFSHEYMGMPSALAFQIDKIEGRGKDDKTIFYAHEVSTARVVVENHPGHDFTFYNILNKDAKSGISLEEEFGSFSNYSRNELVKLASELDFVFAVSDIVKDEFLYLCPDADKKKIKTVFNGIPRENVSFRDKKSSIKIIGEYCKDLFGFVPDHVFTHVTRLVVSKALWRDIRLLYHLDEFFRRKNKKGFFVLLSTLVGNGRNATDIENMESEYGWPVVHKEGWPDLISQEVDIYRYLEIFNAKSKAIKGIFINQFGFDHARTGKRVPKKASILSLRLASDVEFGMSIYEPFGIAQLETLPYGGIPVLSAACGCASILQKTMPKDEYLVINFADVPKSFKKRFKSKDDFINATKEERDSIETQICENSAKRLFDLLPNDNKDRKKRFKLSKELSKALDWEHVAERIGKHLKP